MELKDFAKKYYDYVMKRLGSLSAFNPMIDVLMSKPLEETMMSLSPYIKKAENPILGIIGFELDETKDIPNEVYGKFMNLIAEYYPDLSQLMANNELLSKLLSSNVFYKSFIDNNIEMLRQMGVLS